jgi:hypothetical protein
MATTAPAKSTIRKVTTPRFRASFVYIFTPQQPMEGAADKTPKYGTTMLFDVEAQKTKEYEALKALAVHAAKEKFGDKLVPDGNGWFKLGALPLRNPLRDGAEKPELDGYGDGVKFAAATSKMQPGLVDENLQRILSDQDFRSGDYARATVTAYGYDKAGNKGVAFGLQNVQRLGRGEAFSGRTAAENDFDQVDNSFGGEGTGGTEESFLN